MKKVVVVLIILISGFCFTVSAGESKTHKKLKEIIIPRINLQDVTIEEAVAEIRRLSKMQDPEGEGINIIYVKAKKPAKAKVQKKD